MTLVSLGGLRVSAVHFSEHWRRSAQMVEFKTLTYETVTVGEEFMSDDFLIKPEDVDTYAYAVDDHNAWFFESSPFGGSIAHPTLMANQALLMRHSRYIVP